MDVAANGARSICVRGLFPSILLHVMRGGSDVRHQTMDLIVRSYPGLACRGQRQRTAVDFPRVCIKPAMIFLDPMAPFLVAISGAASSDWPACQFIAEFWRTVANSSIGVSVN